MKERKQSIVRVIDGDEIPPQLFKDSRCYRCGEEVGGARKHLKIASLSARPRRGKIELSWIWLCESCGCGIQDFLRGDNK